MFLAKKMLMHSGDVSITSPANPGLVVMYTMDDVSGTTIFDGSTNTNDGVTSGTVVYEPGVINNSIRFRTNGIIDIGDMPRLAGSGPRSFSWFSKKVWSDGVLYSSGVDTLNNAFTIRFGRWNTGDVSILFGGGVVVGTLAAGLLTNSFKHFVVTYNGGLADAGSIQVFVDGVEQTVVNRALTGGTPNTTNTNFSMGYDRTTEGSTFTLSEGSVDHFKAFDLVLTPEEVLELLDERIV